MNILRRILHYLILWVILFVVLCVISLVRYWDEFIYVMSTALDKYISNFLVAGLLIGILIWGYRTMFRALR